jgi:hypothetical protein
MLIVTNEWLKNQYGTETITMTKVEGIGRINLLQQKLQMKKTP